MCNAEDMAIKAPKMQGAVHHQSTRQLLLTTVFASFGCASLAEWSLAEKGPWITRESPQATGFGSTGLSIFQMNTVGQQGIQY